MKRDIKLIGLDLDGTTLTDHKTITPRVRQAIANATRQGIVVLPATGRQLSGIPQEFLEIPGVRYALAANGALVFDLHKNQAVHTDYFDEETALSLLEYLRGLDAAVALYIDGNGYAEKLDFDGFADGFDPEILEYIKQSRIPVPSLAALIEEGRPIEKFSIMFRDAAVRDQAIEHLQSRGDNCTTSSLEMNLEVNTLTANKGAGLVALGRRLGIGLHQIMAVGDGGNDIEMLKTVGYGVAMGNAAPEVKAAADAVTLPCDEDGVAVAIEKILA